MIRRPPRSTQSRSSAASDVYKRQEKKGADPVIAKFVRDIFRKFKTEDKHYYLNIVREKFDFFACLELKDKKKANERRQEFARMLLTSLKIIQDDTNQQEKNPDYYVTLVRDLLDHNFIDCLANVPLDKVSEYFNAILKCELEKDDVLKFVVLYRLRNLSKLASDEEKFQSFITEQLLPSNILKFANQSSDETKAYASKITKILSGVLNWNVGLILKGLNDPQYSQLYCSLLSFYLWKYHEHFINEENAQKDLIYCGESYLSYLLYFNVTQDKLQNDQSAKFYERLKDFNLGAIEDHINPPKKKDSAKPKLTNYIRILEKVESWRQGLEDQGVEPREGSYRTIIENLLTGNLNNISSLNHPIVKTYTTWSQVASAKRGEEATESIEKMTGLDESILEFLKLDPVTSQMCIFFLNFVLASKNGCLDINRLPKLIASLEKILEKMTSADPSVDLSNFGTLIPRLVVTFAGEIGKSEEITPEQRQDLIISIFKDTVLANPKVNENFPVATIYEVLDKVIDLVKSPIISIADNYFVTKIIDLLKALSKIFPMDIKPIISILKIINGDFSQIDAIVEKLTRGNKKAVKLIKDIIKQIKDLGIFGNQETARFDKVQDSGDWKEIMNKIAEGKASSKDLFRMIDKSGNGNGSIDKTEYKQLAERLGNPLSDHRINEIFAEIKKATGSTQTDLDEEEFEEALKYIQDKNIFMTLEAMGISASSLVGMLTMLLILLLLLFAFIFVGIEAFALGGAFGAVINSVIPAAVGGGLGGKKESKDEKLDDKKVAENAKKTKKILTSKNL
eukprot:TRINITY_DN1590_c0_g1_i2.p1 TRINITY_DN1590_c0_g1~~TRINITY_DN1590_c0_g1_i2.p1  ORF type:complete len:795 (+),score=171.48 TRINITY_DN1590_c0_g1_i2:34-2418(+)